MRILQKHFREKSLKNKKNDKKRAKKSVGAGFLAVGA